jgi:hypothetical protein
MFCMALAACGFSSEPPRLFPDAMIDAPPPSPDANDPDGDGVVDDNCPAIANTDQVDGDDDGVGDACDSCVAVANPPRETPGAAAPIQRDHDGDGRGDECDLCPHVGSADDVDTDSDGIGAACDPEPAIKNPPAYFNGFYDPPDATWTVPAGGGVLADWEVAQRADGTIGWRQRVLDGSQRHHIVRAGSTQEHFIDSVLVVEGIAAADGVTALRGAELTYGFVPTVDGPVSFICGVERDELNELDLIQSALLQNDVLIADKTAPWPAPLLETRIHVVGQATRIRGTMPGTGDSALSCAAGDVPKVTVISEINEIPDGQLGLRTFGMIAWFDYVFYVETIAAP